MVKKVLSLICGLFLFIASCGCHNEIINLDYETLKDSVKSIEIVKIIYEVDTIKLELIKEISVEEKTPLLKDLENIDFYVEYGDPRTINNYLAIKINFTQEDYYLITQVTFYGYSKDEAYLIEDTNPYHKGTNSYYDINALINKYLTNGDGGDL